MVDSLGKPVKERPDGGAYRAGSARSRLYWNACNPGAGWFDIPHELSGERPPNPYRWEARNPREHARFTRKLEDFLNGESPSLLHRLCGKNGQVLAWVGDPFLYAILEADRRRVLAFFESACGAYRLLRRHFKKGRKYPIGQAELDDLKVRIPH